MMTSRDEASWRAVVEAVAHVGSWSTTGSPEEPITWSAECARIFGGSVEHPPTVSEFMRLVHPDDRARVIAASEEAAQQGKPCETEHRILVGSEVRWVYARAEIQGHLEWEGEQPRASTSALGAPYFVVGVVQDITARKAREHALEASERRYREIIEHTSEGIWMYDAQGITRFVNARMAQMLGYGIEEIVGRSVFDFVPPIQVNEVNARISRRKRGVAERNEAQLIRRDGSVLWAFIHSDPILDASGAFQGSLALVTDVTDQRQANETRNLLAAIVEGSADAILGMTLDGVITSANRGAELIFGYESRELIGSSIDKLLPDDRRQESFELLGRIADGQQVREHETVRKHKNGADVHVSLSVSPIRDAAGSLVGVSKIARDIGGRIAAQRALEEKEEQLRQGQKMEAIGSLAGGVAHDFNNLLSVILGYTALVANELEDEALRDDLQQVQTAGMRAVKLTRQLLAFSRKQILQPAVIDVHAVIGNMQEMLSRLVGEHIEIALTLQASPSNVLADEGQLEQLLMNLVVNARDALPDGGKIEIITASVGNVEDGAARELQLAPGRYLRLSVVDDGIGMDEATRARIFEPFFTTKEKSKGTGLGLSMAYGMARQSGGAIGVQSRPGAGARFDVYLPESQELPIVAPPEPIAEAVAGSETILLAEDEAALLTFMAVVLRQNGYRVIEAANGSEAMERALSYSGQIHLLVADVVMPRMSGKELASRLTTLRPELKALFVSGYSENVIAHEGAVEPGLHYLEKPLMPAALLRKVRSVLDAG
jgi:two-component system cell cycle sensor histidine kinase/response regulator CckA